MNHIKNSVIAITISFSFLLPAASFARGDDPRFNGGKVSNLDRDNQKRNDKKVYKKRTEQQKIDRNKLKYERRMRIRKIAPEFETEFDKFHIIEDPYHTPPFVLDKMRDNMLPRTKRYPKQAIKFVGTMAEFYMAVMTINYWDCFRTKDPSICAAFIDSLKDPRTYAGFALFVVAANQTSSALQKIAKRNFFGIGSLGLAAGMFASDVFSGFAYNPLVEKYYETSKIRDEEARSKLRNEILGELWRTTFGDKNWYKDKVPDLVGLIAAASATGVLFRYAPGSITKALGSTNNLIKFVNKGKGLKALIKARRGIQAYEAVTAGLVVVWNGSRIVKMNPIVQIGSQLIHTIVFLKFADLIDEPLRAWWNRDEAADKLADSMDRLETFLAMYNVNVASLFNFSRYDDRRKRPPALNGEQFDLQLKEQIKKTQEAWDEYRNALLIKPYMVHGRFIGELGSLDDQLMNRYSYYLWIANGMDPNDEQWVSNQYNWHRDDPFIFLDDKFKPYRLTPEEVKNDGVYDLVKRELKQGFLDKEIYKALRDFFCAKLKPEASVIDSIDVHGIPVPFYSRPEIASYKIAQIDGACIYDSENLKVLGAEYMNEKCTLDAPGSCKFTRFAITAKMGEYDRSKLHKLRQELLEEIDFTEEVENAMAVLIDKTEPIKNRITEKYDGLIRKELLSSLSGHEVNMVEVDERAADGELFIREPYGNDEFSVDDGYPGAIGDPVNIFKLPRNKVTQIEFGNEGSVKEVGKYKFPAGVIATFKNEYEFWKNLEDKYQTRREYFEVPMSALAQKAMAVQDVFTYFTTGEKPMPQILQMYMENSPSANEQAQMLRSFILDGGI